MRRSLGSLARQDEEFVIDKYRKTFISVVLSAIKLDYSADKKSHFGIKASPEEWQEFFDSVLRFFCRRVQLVNLSNHSEVRDVTLPAEVIDMISKDALAVKQCPGPFHLCGREELGGNGRREIDWGKVITFLAVHRLSGVGLRSTGFSSAQLKDECGFSCKQLNEAGFSFAQLKEAGFSCKQLQETFFGGVKTAKEAIEARTSFSASDIMAAYNLKKGHQFVASDPSNKVGQVVFAEGKVGVITDTFDSNYCKISYSDGSRNKDMDDGYLRFATYYSYPVERVWSME